MMVLPQKFIPYWVLVTLFALLSVCEGHAAVTLSASISNKVIRVGENTQIIVSISTDGGESYQDPQFPVIDGLSFAFRGTASTSTNMQVFNGRMKTISEKSLVYLVQGNKEGNYTIEPIQVSVGGSTVRANSVQLTVLAAPPTPAPQEGVNNASPVQLQATTNSDGIMLVPELSKSEVYVGEEVQILFTAFFPVNVSRIGLDDKRGQFQNFWVESFELLDSNRQDEIIYENRRYIRVPIRRYFVYPLTSGEQTIEPLTMTCEVRMGGRLGLFTQGRESTVVSVPIKIQVKPLPKEGKPDIFEGAVGQFSLSSHVEETEVSEGSPVTLSVSLSGYGNIRNAPSPVLPDLSKFDAFDPTKDESISVTEDGISGSVKYNHVLLPQDTNANQIGPVRYAYFDPAKEEYITLNTEPVSITVFPSQRSGTRMSTSGANRRMITKTSEDFRYIAVTPSALATVYLPLYRSAGYWFMLVLPVFLVGGVWLYQRKLDFLQNNPDLVRRSKAPKLAEKLLADAKQGIKEKDALKAYAAISKALNDYISNRWNIACAGLTSEELQRQLMNQSIPEDISNNVLQLLQTCDAARFSGSGMGQETLQQDYEKTRQVMSELFKVKS
jgi:hypothetical protein